MNLDESMTVDYHPGENYPPSQSQDYCDNQEFRKAQVF
jgi:hypothetical protein